MLEGLLNTPNTPFKSSALDSYVPHVSSDKDLNVNLCLDSCPSLVLESCPTPALDSCPTQPADGCPTPILQSRLLNDPKVPNSSLDPAEEVSKILDTCNLTVGQLRDSHEFPARIHVTFRRNQKIMHDYLLVFQYKFGLKKLLLSVLNKISNNEFLSDFVRK